MNTKPSSELQRKRKFLLMIPILVIPFLGFGFWALGGGKAVAVKNTSTDSLIGINLDLPGAHLKDDNKIDKLGFYEQAEEDSSKIRAAIKDDPYYNSDLAFEDESVVEKNSLPNIEVNQSNNTEDKINTRLRQLNDAINNSSAGTEPKIDDDAILARHPDAQVGLPQTEESIPDPEVEQLNTMLDKIKDIQHPERLKEQEDQKAQQNKYFLVHEENSKDSVMPGFFGWSEEEHNEPERPAKGIAALVYADQTLVSGAVVKLRLSEQLFIDEDKLSPGQFIFGIASLHDERLLINIPSIRIGSNIFPVQLAVYDLDGLEGIYIPGTITRETLKQSGDNGLSAFSSSSIDPSIAAQVAAASITTAKDLLSKKIKLVKGQVKAGYQIILQNKTNR